MAEQKEEKKAEKVETYNTGYKAHPLDAVEEVEFKENFGPYSKGDKVKVHPNTAILYKNRKLIK